MDLFKFALLVCAFLIIAALAPLANALEFTPLSEDFVNSVKTQFEAAQSPDLNLLESKKQWHCQLYGVRSRKQSTQKNNFYAFHKFDRTKNEVHNSGSQIIETYKKDEHQLKGKIGGLADNLRMSADKKSLISEISIPNRKDPAEALSDPISLKPIASAAEQDHTVIAYTLCSK